MEKGLKGPKFGCFEALIPKKSEFWSFSKPDETAEVKAEDAPGGAFGPFSLELFLVTFCFPLKAKGVYTFLMSCVPATPLSVETRLVSFSML